MTNVALVVLDTLRKDTFDDHFNWLPGTNFENAWAPGSWTIPVHAAMFTGRYPSEVGVHIKNEQFDTPRPALAEQLQKAGYMTRAYSCNPCVSDIFSFDRGFDDFNSSSRKHKRDPELFDWNRFITASSNRGISRYPLGLWNCITEDVKTLSSIRHGLELKLEDMGYGHLLGEDDKGAKEVLEYITETQFGEDEFLLLNLMEAHAPYDPPEQYKRSNLSHSPSLSGTVLGSDVDSKELRQAYDSSVAYLSDVYREIFDQLNQDFDVIITLGDHGEMFGNEGIWGHGHSVHPELTHVPLSISGLDLEHETVDDVVSLLDVHCTILDLSGVKGESRGRNLSEPLSEEEPITERFGLNKRRKEMLRGAGADKEQIERYDKILRGVVTGRSHYVYEILEGIETYGEISNEERSEEEILAEAVEKLEIRDISESTGEDLSDDVMAQLEDLGYA